MRKSMTNWASHKIFLTATAIAAAMLFFYFFFVPSADAPGYGNATIAFPEKGVVVLAEVADTVEARAQGLSGRRELLEGSGMWFVFEEEGEYGFWMKDMRFSIDIIWLDARLRIVDMWENASPDSFPEVVMPKVPARYVLEVPAGFAAAHSLAVGDGAAIVRKSE